MKKLTTFLYAILAGVAIAMGGVAFLTIENKVVGAVFSVITELRKLKIEGMSSPYGHGMQ